MDATPIRAEWIPVTITHLWFCWCSITRRKIAAQPLLNTSTAPCRSQLPSEMPTEWMAADKSSSRNECRQPGRQAVTTERAVTSGIITAPDLSSVLSVPALLLCSALWLSAPESQRCITSGSCCRRYLSFVVCTRAAFAAAAVLSLCARGWLQHSVAFTDMARWVSTAKIKTDLPYYISWYVIYICTW